MKVAWNEDTVNTYQFSMWKRNRFQYMASYIDKAGKKQMEFYDGKYKDDSSGLVLIYDKNHAVPGTVPYLYWTYDQQYLVQHFSDGRPRMYLRVAYPSRHFR